MSVFVVDASLVLKWFVPEIHSEAARRWLDEPHDYFAPDLIFPETGNAIWKKAGRGEIAEADAERLIEDLPKVAVETVRMRDLLPDAYRIARAARISVYDATYVALAIRLDTSAITCDERLLRKFEALPLIAAHLRWVEDIRRSTS